MARIRSVHPSLFTDEAWVSCSPLARVLYIGLWTDADDQGLFEWKPLQVRMRLLPGDDCQAAALLDELASAGLIAAFDHAGRRFGAIKEFRKYQRPKKPNSIHVLPAEWVEYVGLTHPDSEPEPSDDDEVPNQFPTEGEKSPQMEDGGCRVGEGSEDATASFVAVSDGAGDFEALWKAYPHVKGRSSKPKAFEAWKLLSADVRRWLPAAAGRYARGGTIPQGGAPALAKWLAEERWSDWLLDVGNPQDPPLPWRGPAEVRDAFRAKLGEDWCRTYLDRCAWQDVPERALIPATRYAGTKLVRDARQILAQLNLTVLEKAA